MRHRLLLLLLRWVHRLLLLLLLRGHTVMVVDLTDLGSLELRRRRRWIWRLLLLLLLRRVLVVLPVAPVPFW